MTVFSTAMGLSVTMGGLAGPAAAHVGHLGEAAGHDHRVAGAALGAAVLVGLWAAWKGRKARTDAPEDAAAEEAKT